MCVCVWERKKERKTKRRRRRTSRTRKRRNPIAVSHTKGFTSLCLIPFPSSWRLTSAAITAMVTSETTDFGPLFFEPELVLLTMPEMVVDVDLSNTFVYSLSFLIKARTATQWVLCVSRGFLAATSPYSLRTSLFASRVNEPR